MPTYHISVDSGNDSNDGLTIETAFQTISKAADFVKPGDTILVYPGIYRERICPVNSGSSTAGIKYISVEKGKAIIRGSVTWEPSGTVTGSNIIKGEIPDSIFKDTSAIDGANPFKIASIVTPYGRNGAPEVAMGIKDSDLNMIYTLGQVFLGDSMLLQTPFYSEMSSTPKSWFYDSSVNLLYVNLGDYCLDKLSVSPIEITNQRRLFAPHIRGLRYITVDGFIFERCANHYPNKFWVNANAQQAGMIGTRSGKYWTIQNNIIRFANGIGIDWGNEGGQMQDLEIGKNGFASGSYGHTIQNNEISDNGAAGTAAYMAKSFIFSKNIVTRNNNLKFYGKQKWESAGLKIHQPTGSIITENIIYNNFCHGIWSDQGAGIGSNFQKNFIYENKGSGINFEIGSGTNGVVDKNIFWNNETGISFVTSGGVNIKNNIFLGSSTADITTTIFNRPTDKWDSLNISIINNLFSGNSPVFLQLSSPNPMIPSSRFLNNNIYCISELDDHKFILLPDTGSSGKMNFTFSNWQKKWNQLNGGILYDQASTIISNISVIKINKIGDNKYELIKNFPDGVPGKLDELPFDIL